MFGKNFRTGSVIALAEREAAARAAGPAVPPGLMPSGFGPGSGRNAHSIVDALVGTPQPITIAQAFGIVAGTLAKNSDNADLAGELEGLRQRIDARLAEQREARQKGLRDQHAAVYGKCRAALDKVNRLQVDSGRAEGLMNSSLEARGRLRAAYLSAEGRKPQAETYPTAAELDAWLGEVSEARERMDAAEKSFAEFAGEASRLGAELSQATRELGALQEQEQNLAAALAGQPYRNSLGLLEMPE